MNISISLHQPATFYDDLRTYSQSIKTALSETAQKIQEFLQTPGGKFFIGLGLGAVGLLICGPLSSRIVTPFIDLATFADPFTALPTGVKILLAPLICLVGPICEEYEFREGLQNALKAAFQEIFSTMGMTPNNAVLASRISAIFFGSVIFGLVHFTNALVFWCNPIVFLPQVVFATMFGLCLGLVKEMSGDLTMPMAMHICNNTIAWGFALMS
jgi:membrane protease YdiL (CAAX protease family)